MKKLIFIALLFLVGCTTEEQSTPANYEKIGDTTRNNDMTILSLSPNYDGWEDGLGVLNPPYDDGTYRVSFSPIYFNSTELDTVVTYSCPIANIASIDYSGQNDWVVNKETDGLAIGNGDYNFPGMLSITTFQNGLPIRQVMKQTFNLSATTYLVGYNPFLQINYNAGLPNAPYMVLPAGTADNYTNRAKVRQGKNLIVVHFNPDGLVHETNTDNNVTFLPLNVNFNGTTTSNLGTAVVDPSAILENKTIPPSNAVAVRTRVKGKTNVFLNWDCPYHEPIYVKHHFTIKRNGIVVANNVDHSDFTDVISGNPQIITYTITTTTDLGESLPTTVTVTR